MSDQPMPWKGQELRTARDIMLALISCQSAAEAQEFYVLYADRHGDEVTRENIRYALTYHPSEVEERVCAWLGFEPMDHGFLVLGAEYALGVG